MMLRYAETSLPPKPREVDLSIVRRGGWMVA
jgi:hypothetical protein